MQSSQIATFNRELLNGSILWCLMIWMNGQQNDENGNQKGENEEKAKTKKSHENGLGTRETEANRIRQIVTDRIGHCSIRQKKKLKGFLCLLSSRKLHKYV